MSLPQLFHAQTYENHDATHAVFCFTGRFNISPLSVNISTAEFALLTSHKVSLKTAVNIFISPVIVFVELSPLHRHRFILVLFACCLNWQYLFLSSPVSAQAGESLQDIKGEGVLHLLLQPWEAREVSVIFTPSEHKPTTTILIIRYLTVSLFKKLSWTQEITW